MEKPPNSYKDPFWTDLSLAAERKHGLPEGLLVNIVQKGERSNNDQVSEAKARTVYQITDNTRKLVLDKYGIDPLLSPENAADAAALLLKEGLQRNKGDVAQAVAEYHGGTNRANWGPRTRSYVKRVVGDVQPQEPQAGSTFSRALAQRQSQEPVNQISMVYEAYKNGKMAPDEAAEFEADVQAGNVMLPRGASLKGQRSTPTGSAAPEAMMLPQAISDAYERGQLSEQERSDLEADIRAGIVKLPPSAVQQIPMQGNQPLPTEQPIIQRPQAPTLSERLLGGGEAGLGMLTGALGGSVGMAAGTVEGITKSIINSTYGTQQGVQDAERTAMQRAGQLTYAPRTEQGQEQLEAVGSAAGNLLMPLGGMPGEMAALARGSAAARPAVQATRQAMTQSAQQALEAVKPGVATAVEAVRTAPRRAAEAAGIMERVPEAPASVPGRPSIGAAGVPDETLRIAKAESLPVPVNLTRGAITRDAAELAFEKEQLKNPSLGAPLRKRLEENNIQMLQNMDALIDMTGAQAPDLASSGSKVVQSLSEGYKAAKNKTNVAYTKAKKSPEAQAPVDPNTIVSIGEGDAAIKNSLIGYLNEKVSGVPSVAVPDTARKILIKLGLAEDDANGNLIGKPATVGKMEEFRKELSGTAKWDDRVGLREETILKKLVDAQTEPLAGPLYKEARSLRQQQARKYENRAIVARLITNRKGMDDPKVAVDQVFNKSILNGSPEEITFLKRVLNTSGGDGQQAWKELQGATLGYIRDEATKGMGMDSADNPIVSPAKLHSAVSKLDKNGRLDIVLGKKNAEIVRDLNDVVRYVNTTPPGTLINNSGTAGTLMAAIAEAGTTGALTGLPVPVISVLRMLKNEIRDAKIKSQIQMAINTKNKKNETAPKF